MEETWASGALELLKHADSHIKLESAFDSRIAFISIDNSVETSIRTFLSLPQKKSGIKIPRKEIDEAGNSFPHMVEILFKYVPEKLFGLDDGDIEHYHRIRNQLYHNGTGLAVDERYLLAYRQIASVLLNNLFGISISHKSNESSLENLVLLYNEIESLLIQRFEENGIDTAHTYKWEAALENKILTLDDINSLTNLRMIRNEQVHSTIENIDREKVALGVELANKLINVLKL